MRIKEYYFKYATLHPACMHSLEEDEKRLQDVFSDPHLKLRYNNREKFVQVWDESPQGLRCLFNIDGHYDLCRAIWELKRRQKTKKQLLEMYSLIQETRKKENDQKIDELARETAGLVQMRSVGKVTVSG